MPQARLLEELGTTQTVLQESLVACQSYEADTNALKAALAGEKDQRQQVSKVWNPLIRHICYTLGLYIL